MRVPRAPQAALKMNRHTITRSYATIYTLDYLYIDPVEQESVTVQQDISFKIDN